MKSSLLVGTLTFWCSFLFAANQGLPPKSWWGEAEPIYLIEQENASSVAQERKLFDKMHFQCSESKKLVNDSQKIKSIPCSKYEVPVFSASIDLSKNKRWSKLKSLMLVNDKVHYYSASPFSGSFGYILVRDNVIIYTIVLGDK
jgi:hypothetical protein